jgi:putative NADH-flavin reductase
LELLESLAHNHSVTAFVRNPKKPQALFPSSVVADISIIRGNGTSQDDIAAALRSHEAKALVNAAGAASVMPWSKSQVTESRKQLYTLCKPWKRRQSTLLEAGPWRNVTA